MMTMTKKTIAIGGDHAGFGYKSLLIAFLEEAGHTVKDRKSVV